MFFLVEMYGPKFVWKFKHHFYTHDFLLNKTLEHFFGYTQNWKKSNLNTKFFKNCFGTEWTKCVWIFKKIEKHAALLLSAPGSQAHLLLSRLLLKHLTLWVSRESVERSRPGPWLAGSCQGAKAIGMCHQRGRPVSFRKENHVRCCCYWMMLMACWMRNFFCARVELGELRWLCEDVWFSVWYCCVLIRNYANNATTFLIWTKKHHPEIILEIFRKNETLEILWICWKKNWKPKLEFNVFEQLTNTSWMCNDLLTSWLAHRQHLKTQYNIKSKKSWTIHHKISIQKRKQYYKCNSTNPKQNEIDEYALSL